MTLDAVYNVNDIRAMPTVVQSCRLEKEDAALLARQAKRRNLEASTLSSIYLTEKTREEEYPGIGFRDAAGGREAYVAGHRVAVWEVVWVHEACKTVPKTADYFDWPESMIRSILTYAAAFPTEIAEQRRAETSP